MTNSQKVVMAKNHKNYIKSTYINCKWLNSMDRPHTTKLVESNALLTGGWLRSRWWMVCLRVSQTSGPLASFSGRSCRSGSSPTLHVITWRCCTMSATEAVLAALLTVVRRCKFFMSLTCFGN